MMRACVVGSSSSAAMATQLRFIRTGMTQDTLKPDPGKTAGTLMVMNEISVNPDADEDRKRPTWRQEVFPKRPEHSYLATMYKWGYNSLTLFKKVNEDPGQWWNANSSTLTSNWAQIGDYAAAGLWSGVWRFTYGVGQYNMKPGEFRRHAFGRKDKNGALTIDYAETITEGNKLIAQHLPEHQKHRRFKNPTVAGFEEVEPAKAKRIEREAQYHLGMGNRLYLVDGYMGAHPKTATIFRVITDNADHAYAVSMYAHRQSNIHSYRELPLLKRTSQSPMDEWSWRRPGVVLLHCPGYSFELPRIVEEFGGPRPADLGLTSPKFTFLDPYSIPMRGVIGANPSTEELIDTLGFLCSRWAYYADDHGHLTLNADAIVSPDGSGLTAFIDVTGGKADLSSVRSSPFLWGSKHLRIGDGVVSRAWDAISLPTAGAKTQKYDFVESSLGVLHRPLSTRINGAEGTVAVSHRFEKKRNIANFGFKRPHNYTEDKAAKAASAGMLFKAKEAPLLKRAGAFRAASVKWVVINGESGAQKNMDGTEAATSIISALQNSGRLYADADVLKKALATSFSASGGVSSAGSSEIKKLLKSE